MKNLNEIIGENLTFLRKKAGFTQLELGEKFNYSDKTVSKWEQGSVLPSVDVYDQADPAGVLLVLRVVQSYRFHALPLSL